MLDSTQFEQLAEKLLALVPPGLLTLEQDLRQQFHDVLQAAFAQMDIVTREEFDVQVKVLARTREKVEALQQQLDTLLQK